MDEFKELQRLNPWAEPWIDFTASMTQANIFHHPLWLSLLAECYGYRPFVIALHDSKIGIIAGLPIMEINNLLTGRSWVSLPFSDHCSPLFGDVTSLWRLTEVLVSLSKEGGAPRIELREEYPSHPSISIYSDYVLHTLALDPDPEAVLSRFHPMHRRNINKAQKSGIRIERGTGREHLNEFYRLHLITRRRQGIPIQPRRFFDLLGKNILERGLGFVLLVYREEDCIAAGVYLHWQQTLTYKYGASSPEWLSLRPNNLLMWTAIRWGCENGFRIFDFGKTDVGDIGLRTFKSGWGAVEVPLIYSTIPSKPSQSSSSKLMPVMQKVIQNSPLWVCRAAGEIFYRYFP